MLNHYFWYIVLYNTMPLSNNDVKINHIYYWIPKDVKIQVSESKSSCRTSLTHITIYQILLVYSLVKLILKWCYYPNVGRFLPPSPLPPPPSRTKRGALPKNTKPLYGTEPRRNFLRKPPNGTRKNPGGGRRGRSCQSGTRRRGTVPPSPRFDVGLRSKSSVVDELSDGGGIYIYI